MTPSIAENTADHDALRSKVSERYADAARTVLDGGGCCGSLSPPDDSVSGGLYSAEETDSIPAAAAAASLGCGNPTALTELNEGEVVLDLGSGGGIDVLLSARRVGHTGLAYGLDMTDEMLDLARRNQTEAGVENAEFLKGTIEDVPLPDASVDVVISNCVINLSPDKPRVFAEAFRVLRPGGRLAVSDIVARGELDPQIRDDIEAWAGCVAGAIEEDEYRAGLEAAGFVDVEIEATRIFEMGESSDPSGTEPPASDDGGRCAASSTTSASLVSAFIRARKP